MNLCHCGHLGDARRECRCNPRSIARYRARLSGPLIDRIDLHVEVPGIAYQGALPLGAERGVVERGLEGEGGERGPGASVLPDT